MERMKDESLDIENLPEIESIIYMDSVSSTQDVAREICVNSSATNCLVIAEEQTEGKGRMGRKWSSERGGIYMTLVLRPKIQCRFVKGLSYFTGGIIRDTLKELYKIKARVKAPNDVYAYSPKNGKYRKIAGILTTSATINKDSNWVLVGIGVNVNNELPPDLKNNAVSVKQIKGRAQDRKIFLRRFFELFWAKYSHWEAGSEVKSH